MSRRGTDLSTPKEPENEPSSPGGSGTSPRRSSQSNSEISPHAKVGVPPNVLPYMRKVAVPPKQNLWKEFKTNMKETFFADDPFRTFKDQTTPTRLLLGLRAIFPILEWGRQYNLKKFRGDFIAGITIASLCIPQDLGYAKLVNLEPQYGLYSSFVPPLIYACMGSSRDIAIGPVSIVSLLLGTLIRDVIDPSADPIDFRRLAFTATFFAGVTQFALGFFRLGFFIDFLSHAAIVGFMAGASITISLQQLKGLLGIKKFTTDPGIVSVMGSVITTGPHGWNWQTIAIGVSFLVFLIVVKYIGKKNKRFFWVTVIAPMFSVTVSTLSVYVFRADKEGVQIVNHIKKGVNPPSARELFWTGKYLFKGIKIGIVAGIVALTEGISIGRTFAAMRDYQIDGNKEMVAMGTMNVIGSMTSCYVATGSFSRSAVNYMAGCCSAVSNIVMSCVVLLVLLVLTPLFKYTPNAILASIIISAVLGLIDIKAMILIWRVDKCDFLACMGAFFGVVFIDVQMGLIIAVIISIGKLLLQVTRPRTAVLGKIPRTTVYRNIQQFPEATRIPGVLIVRVDSAIYFSNSNYARERILRWLADEEERLQENDLPRIRNLIIEMSPVTDIDTSGIHAFEDLFRALHKKDIQLILANPGPIVMAKLHASKFTSIIGDDKIFLTVDNAVQSISYKDAEP